MPNAGSQSGADSSVSEIFSQLDIGHTKEYSTDDNGFQSTTSGGQFDDALDNGNAKGPLDQQTGGKADDEEDALKAMDYSALSKKTHDLMQEVVSILDHMFQIQELRHTAQLSASSLTSARLEPILASLSSSLATIRPSIVQLQSDVHTYTGERAQDLADGVEELVGEYKIADERQKGLKQEVKEDEWLAEFETSADQVESLMEPLQKSLGDCRAYLERLSRSAGPIPEKSDFDEQLSLEGLQTLSRDHESLSKTYVPSTNRTLRRLDKDISEKRINNGTALRRFNELSRKWVTLQSHLQHLDSKIQLALQQASSGIHSEAQDFEMEMLADETAPYPQTDYSNGQRPSLYNGHRRTPRSSISSNSNVSSASIPSVVQASRRPPSASGTSGPPSLGRRASILSNSSISTARTSSEKPRWNSSPKVADTATPSALPRTRPIGTRGSRPSSPTPSSTSLTSLPSRRQSRLPVYSPKGKGKSALISPRSDASESDYGHVPKLSLPGTGTLGTPTNKGQSHLERARMGLKTPEPTRPRLTGSFSALQPRVSNGLSTPTAAGRSWSSNSLSTPKSAPAPRPAPRFSLARAPPSSFNSPTPTGRPSSRLSTMSYSGFDHSVLTPFRPSPYDELDKDVARVIKEETFQDHWTARVDQPLKRGQRLAEGQEWKGEYVFGAGEKPTPVKRMELGGKRAGMERRVKIMVKTGGRWVDLAEVLRERKDIMEVVSP